ncbi:hypothetical protein NBRGN_058_00580 [Nocardia brasiliensis NBRC 14402]|uniref:hypothetical protein n=1 Tax=Nocardia brasiliensis TaxID=37326 RepID=UPI00045D02A9|nr:hypothetical protein [Nocardia brasiliensis]GAJ82906.1 hypothetical protein NBRGN_058_00580 [Nocardia brasiliensis NBRC 14402]
MAEQHMAEFVHDDVLGMPLGGVGAVDDHVAVVLGDPQSAAGAAAGAREQRGIDRHQADGPAAIGGDIVEIARQLPRVRYRDIPGQVPEPGLHGHAISLLQQAQCPHVGHDVTD